MIQFINEFLVNKSIEAKEGNYVEYIYDVCDAMRIQPKEGDTRKVFPFMKVRANSDVYDASSPVSCRAIKKPDGKIRINLRFIDQVDPAPVPPTEVNVLLMALPYYGVISSVDTSKFHILNSRCARLPEEESALKIGDNYYRKAIYLAFVVDTDENGIADTELVTYSNPTVRRGKNVHENELMKTTYKIHFDKNDPNETKVEWESEYVPNTEFDMTSRVNPFTRWIPENVIDKSSSNWKNDSDRKPGKKRMSGSFYADTGFDANRSQKNKREARRNKNKIYK